MPKLALFVLPGIGASNLKDPDDKIGGFGGDLIFRMVVSNLMRPASSTGGVYAHADSWEVRAGTGGNPVKIARGWYGVDKATNWAFLEYCAASMASVADVFALGYNFWHPNDQSAWVAMKTVATVMAETLPSGAAKYDGFYVLGHSMGGLVGLELLKLIRNQPLWNQFKGFVPVATPFLGAPELTRRFMRGMRADGRDGLLVNYVLGRNGPSFAMHMSKLPSIYELLPDDNSFGHPSLQPIEYYVRESIHESVRHSPARLDRYEAIAKAYRIAAENRRVARMSVFNDPAVIQKIYVIALGNMRTTTGFKLDANNELASDKTMLGDGTVPLVSQWGGLVTGKTIDGVLHDAALKEVGRAEVWPAIILGMQNLN